MVNTIYARKTGKEERTGSILFNNMAEAYEWYASNPQYRLEGYFII